MTDLSPQPDAILSAEELAQIVSDLPYIVGSRARNAEARIARSHEALRRRLADTERERAADERRYHAVFDTAEARLAEVEAERDGQRIHGDAMTAAANRELARADRAEDRVRTLTEALTMIVTAYDGYMETDVLDDLPIAIGFARAVLGSETSGEGTA